MYACAATRANPLFAWHDMDMLLERGFRQCVCRDISTFLVASNKAETPVDILIYTLLNPLPISIGTPHAISDAAELRMYRQEV